MSKLWYLGVFKALALNGIALYFMALLTSLVGCWHGYLSGARCRLAYGPADATATHRLMLQ